jgi:hypothetical protein
MVGTYVFDLAVGVDFMPLAILPEPGELETGAGAGDTVVRDAGVTCMRADGRLDRTKQLCGLGAAWVWLGRRVPGRL